MTAPTLLIVGGDDRRVLDLNREAQARLRCESRLAIVPGASNLFEEAGALARVTELACEWFVEHMPPLSQAVVWVAGAAGCAGVGHGGAEGAMARRAWPVDAHTVGGRSGEAPETPGVPACRVGEPEGGEEFNASDLPWDASVGARVVRCALEG